MLVPNPQPKSERAAPGPPVVGSPDTISTPPYPDSPPGEIGGRACPICGRALIGHQKSACSDRCRAALSRLRRARVQTEKERRLRELAEGILRALGGGPKDFA
jgi:predicted nucleic acid-binding Zn ribbon protein